VTQSPTSGGPSTSSAPTPVVRPVAKAPDVVPILPMNWKSSSCPLSDHLRGQLGGERVAERLNQIAVHRNKNILCLDLDSRDRQVGQRNAADEE